MVIEIPDNDASGIHETDGSSSNCQYVNAHKKISNPSPYPWKSHESKPDKIIAVKRGRYESDQSNDMNKVIDNNSTFNQNNKKVKYNKKLSDMHHVTLHENKTNYCRGDCNSCSSNSSSNSDRRCTCINISSHSESNDEISNKVMKGNNKLNINGNFYNNNNSPSNNNGFENVTATDSSEDNANMIISPQNSQNSIQSNQEPILTNQNNNIEYKKNQIYRNYDSPKTFEMNVVNMINTNSNQTHLDDFFSTPITSLIKIKTKENSFIIHNRPKKAVNTENDIINEFSEPMNTGDTCQCCFRHVSDTIITQRCCFCMKIGCMTCMHNCESCHETFCLHCSTSNYSYLYERILCLDCEQGEK